MDNLLKWIDPRDIVGQVIAGLLLVIIVGIWGLARRKASKKKRTEAGSEPPVPVSDPEISVRRERVSKRLESNAAALVEAMGYLAKQTRQPEDFDAKRGTILHRLKEFREDVKPLLHDLGDVPAEESARRVYGVLEQHLPDLLNYRPAFIMGMDDPEPTPTWEEQYRPFKDDMTKLVPSVADVLEWVQEERGIAPDGRWTRAQRKKIKDDYFAQNGARCPVDGAVLAVMKDYTGPELGKILVVTCPNCGRSAENL